MTGTRTYLAECYSPGIDREAVVSCGQRASAATTELQGQGFEVEYLGALLVPGDEVVFHLFAASSPADVREASVRAGVEFERVLESLPVGINPSPSPRSHRRGFGDDRAANPHISLERQAKRKRK